MKRIILFICLLYSMQAYTQNCSEADINFINGDATFMPNLYNCVFSNSTQSAMKDCMLLYAYPIQESCLDCYINQISCIKSSCMTECMADPEGAMCQSCINNNCITEISACEPETSGLINTKEKKTNFSFLPNPATDIIYIKLQNTNNEDLKINIYTFSGNLVRSEILKQNQQQINVGDLDNGIYLIEIENKEWSEKQKLIIKK